ncbi:RagB/SusD family nutrient uptake outer membrane protein [Cytophaga sp. FL35]|uniref:RagB/SusD family nutrient uptake outer membrane protein n=1 Tax=Cytophaga sp. FL35 TaxID=1904456 RepID=UPI001653A169|nr:RagB/SusD family nutrient uptake outer membrane protein [Cytophaga sp. FL35]MBC6997319.1 RagB/SusD family nutrient uptake outer membrane protein [Cytophaga sp. FL35]
MKRINSLLIVGLILVSQSCNRDDLNTSNPNITQTTEFYSDLDQMETSVSGIFAAVQGRNLIGREYWFLHDLRGDDNQSGGGQLEAPRNQLLIGTNGPTNYVSDQNWEGWYTTIHRANATLFYGTDAEIATADKDRLLAEARFARGWAFFELGTLWGGVPMPLEPALTLEDNLPKSSQQEVLAQALSDFQFAIANLPVASAAEEGRPTKGAAQAMAGRLLMWNGDYAAAKTLFEAIVNSNEYALVDEYDHNFQEETEYNSESILEIGYAEIGDFNWNEDSNGRNELSVRTQEYSAIGWRNLIPSLSLLNEFERESNGATKNDPRFEKSFYSIGDTFNNGEDILEGDAVQGNTVNFEGENQKISWRKYSLMYKLNPGGFLMGGINMRIIRYAEVLLNLAECEYEVGTNASAIAYLNQIRTRASVDMPEYPTANYPVDTDAEVMRAIIHEKRVELNSEQIRNRDILRWRSEGKLTTEPLSHFQANKFELLPIPQEEIDNNGALTSADQNPGY